jgi:hypothetical protein
MSQFLSGGFDKHDESFRTQPSKLPNVGRKELEVALKNVAATRGFETHPSLAQLKDVLWLTPKTSVETGQGSYACGHV